VIDGERWKNVSDETVRFFLGHYGEPPAAVDPEIADRVLSRPQVAQLRSLEPITLEGARRRFGSRIAEEELLLRLTMPAEQVDAMVANRSGEPRTARVSLPHSIAAQTPPASEAPRAHAPSPVVKLLRELASRPAVREFELERDDLRVVWRRA
jgi:oxaloacetate decarboxylase alpha subunit